MAQVSRDEPMDAPTQPATKDYPDRHTEFKAGPGALGR